METGNRPKRQQLDQGAYNIRRPPIKTKIPGHEKKNSNWPCKENFLRKTGLVKSTLTRDDTQRIHFRNHVWDKEKFKCTYTKYLRYSFHCCLQLLSWFKKRAILESLKQTIKKACKKMRVFVVDNKRKNAGFCLFSGMYIVSGRWR